jgi:hypothetical protein
MRNTVYGVVFGQGYTELKIWIYKGRRFALKTVEIPACKIAGLPAQTYYIPVFIGSVSKGVASFGVQFCDLERVETRLFYSWLNDVASFCEMHTQFVARDGWYESPVERWSAIQTLARIAYMHGKLQMLSGKIYTRDDVEEIRTQKLPAIKKEVA